MTILASFTHPCVVPNVGFYLHWNLEEKTWTDSQWGPILLVLDPSDFHCTNDFCCSSLDLKFEVVKDKNDDALDYGRPGFEFVQHL